MYATTASPMKNATWSSSAAVIRDVCWFSTRIRAEITARIPRLRRNGETFTSAHPSERGRPVRAGDGLRRRHVRAGGEGGGDERGDPEPEQPRAWVARRVEERREQRDERKHAVGVVHALGRTLVVGD